MAYMKPGLIGPHVKTKRVEKGLRDLKSRIAGGHTMERRFPRDGRGGPSLPPFRELPIGWSEAHIGGPRHGGMPRPPRPMPSRGPQGFPGMGDIGNAPPWQTQQPGFYESDQMGGGAGPDGLGMPPAGPAEHPMMPPGGLGGAQGGRQMPPGLMELIRSLMGSRGQAQRAPWEGTLPPGFMRGGSSGPF